MITDGQIELDTFIHAVNVLLKGRGERYLYEEDTRILTCCFDWGNSPEMAVLEILYARKGKGA